MNDKSAALLLHGWLEVCKKGAEEKKVKGFTPGFIRAPTTTELNEYFNGCGWPYGGYNKTTHWCGIFVAYLLKQKVGLGCNWVDSKGLSNSEDLETVSGAEARKTGLLPGDIVVLNSAEKPNINHHIIVLETVSSGWIRCIEGNAQGIKPPAVPAVAMNWAGNMSLNNVAHVDKRYRIRG